MEICGTALKWFESYLSDRKQHIAIIGNTWRSSKPFQGLPQGSVLGPILYSLHTSPLADIANAHADDTQIYITFNTSCANEMILSKSKIEACIQDIKNWMILNKLKMNNSKTDFIVFLRLIATGLSLTPLLFRMNPWNALHLSRTSVSYSTSLFHFYLASLLPVKQTSFICVIVQKSLTSLY